MPFKEPSSTIHARKKTKSISKLWGIENLRPPIHVVYPAWDATRWQSEFDKTDRKHGEEIAKIFSQLNEADKQIFSNWLVTIGPLVTTGDVFALQYMLLMIINVHGSGSIVLHEAWRMEKLFKSDPEKTEKLLSKSLVLVGGPKGNPISKRLVTEHGIESLFPSDTATEQKVRILGTDDWVSPDIQLNEQIDTDYGMLLCGANPWSEKYNFIAAMGCHSWGTQAAASLACTDEGAKDILEVSNLKDTYISNLDFIKGLGYVKVTPPQKDSLTPENFNFPQLVVPNCNYQMIWPIEGAPQTNPNSILTAGEYLKQASTGISVDVKIGYSLFWMIFGILLLILGASGVTYWLTTGKGWVALFTAVVAGFLGLSSLFNSNTIKE